MEEEITTGIAAFQEYPQVMVQFLNKIVDGVGVYRIKWPNNLTNVPWAAFRRVAHDSVIQNFLERSARFGVAKPPSDAPEGRPSFIFVEVMKKIKKSNPPPTKCTGTKRGTKRRGRKGRK